MSGRVEGDVLDLQGRQLGENVILAPAQDHLAQRGAQVVLVLGTRHLAAVDRVPVAGIAVLEVGLRHALAGARAAVRPQQGPGPQGAAVLPEFTGMVGGRRAGQQDYVRGVGLDALVLAADAVDRLGAVGEVLEVVGLVDDQQVPGPLAGLASNGGTRLSVGDRSS